MTRVKKEISEETSIEDYLLLLFEMYPKLVGEPIQIVLDAMNTEFKTIFGYRMLSLIYEPIIEFEVILTDTEDEDEFFEGY